MKYLSNYIKNRINNRNRNMMVAVVGQTGSGKSYSGLKLCENIDPDFNVSKVVFSPEQFMDLMVKGKLKKGDCILWDEGGVALGSKDFMTVINRNINYFLQSFRKKNLCVFFTVPDFHFLDLGVRKLLHGILETLSINYRKQECVCKYLHINYSPRAGKIYYRYPRIWRRDHHVKLDRIRIGIPNGKLRKRYEAKKDVFLETLTKDVTGRVRPEKIERKKTYTDKYYLKMIKKKLKGKAITVSAIQAVTNVSNPRARKLRAMVV